MREIDDANPPAIFRGLKPAPPPANVARGIWYQSGYQAGRRRLNVWRGATISLALGMAAMLGLRQTSSDPADVKQLVFVKTHDAPAIQQSVEASSTGAGSYARLLSKLSRDGAHPWDEPDLPAGNPHAPLMHRSRDALESNTYPFNERG